MLSIYAIIPSHISFKLCGAMFVAIPTAIPVVPFIKRFGSFEGKTVGSFLVSSKLGAQSIVSLSISKSISSANLFILASVYLIAAGSSPSIDPKLPCPSTKVYLNAHFCAR